MSETTNSTPVTSSIVRVTVGWLLVGLPLLYGIVQTLSKAASLFTG